jgi:radical SAM family uncharacterized protein
MDLWPRIERVLHKIEKPSRYINSELNSVHKEVSDTGIRVALAYPDVYEVGLPNMGLQILYELMNDRDEVVVERVYAPWLDMESIMREQSIPLFSLETHSAVSEFDIFGFTLQHELIYTNVLNMLDLAGLPVLAAERGEGHPLIVAGGPGTANPEPMTPFIDVFVVGEAEELIFEFIDAMKELKRSCAGRAEVLGRLAEIPGVYVPSLYRVEYNGDGTVKHVRPTDGAPPTITRRIVKDFSTIPVPQRPIIPFMDAVHDRCSVEVMRGCARGCRFCQAGIIYRPVRERSKEQVVAGIAHILETTGYEEISLSSLSSTDYSSVESTLKELSEKYAGQNISLSLPSLRVDDFSIQLLKEIAKVKKTGLTFAPEAGTQRLRDVINKNVTEEDVLRTTTLAFQEGWQRIKLYFMIGLPTETREDIEGIVDLAHKIVDIGLETLPGSAKSRLTIAVSASAFAPKAHTPFEWVAQNSLGEFEEKQRFLAGRLKGRHLSFKWHNPKSSVIEGAIARGDRRVGDAIYRAWRRGCKFDAWTKEFKFEDWLQAFAETGLDMAFYAGRERGFDETLPWGHIDTGVDREFLQDEYRRALRAETTGDCRLDGCTDCGVCPNLDAGNMLYG